MRSSSCILSSTTCAWPVRLTGRSATRGASGGGGLRWLPSGDCPLLVPPGLCARAPGAAARSATNAMKTTSYLFMHRSERESAGVTAAGPPFDPNCGVREKEGCYQWLHCRGLFGPASRLRREPQMRAERPTRGSPRRARPRAGACALLWDLVNRPCCDERPFPVPPPPPVARDHAARG